VDERLSVSPALEAGEVEAAIAIRDDMYSEYLGLHPRDWPDEDVRDEDGYLFLLRDHGEVVGSGRVLPIRSEHVELRAFKRLPGWAERDSRMCEISRIAARSRPGKVPYGWIGLILGAEWLLGNSNLERYIAYARIDLVRLYGVVGAREIGLRFQIPARGSAVYSVLTGNLEEAVEVGTDLLDKAAREAERTARAAAAEAPARTQAPASGAGMAAPG
jgi:hypothetical protein